MCGGAGSRDLETWDWRLDGEGQRLLDISDLEIETENGLRVGRDVVQCTSYIWETLEIGDCGQAVLR